MGSSTPHFVCTFDNRVSAEAVAGLRPNAPTAYITCEQVHSCPRELAD